MKGAAIFRSTIGWHLVRLTLGVLWLGAAWLKWLAYERRSFWPSGEIIPALDLLLIQVEGITSVWLLSGWWPRGSRVVAMCLASAFAGAALTAWIEGRSSCGCLGELAVHPGWMFLIDLVALGLLTWFGPRAAASQAAPVDLSIEGKSLGLVSSLVRAFGRVLRGSRLAVLVGCLVFFVAGLFYVPVAVGASRVLVVAAPCWLTGQCVVPVPPVIDLGTGVAGELKKTEVVLRNRSSRPVKIIGGQRDCGYIATKSLPTVIPPGGTATIYVDVHLAYRPGRKHGAFWLLTDHPAQMVVLCRWTARVVERAKEARHTHHAIPTATATYPSPPTSINIVVHQPHWQLIPSSAGFALSSVAYLMNGPPIEIRPCCIRLFGKQL